MSAAESSIQPKTSAKARASFLLGFFSILLIPGIAAVALGHIGRREIRKSGGRLRGSGLALAGMTLGYLGTAFAAVVLVFGFLMLETDRRAGSQAAAVGSLRAINLALATYSSTYRQGFPRNLAALGSTASGGQKSAQAAGLVDDRLASGLKSNYRFIYTPAHFGENGFADAYSIHADPDGPVLSANHYYTDQTGVIRGEVKRPADASSRPLE